MKPFLLTTMAMIAFAANTIFCRWALGKDFVDPASFTGIRLLSGVIMLLAILWYRQEGRLKPRLDYFASAMLFAYAITFSYAYIDLTTGTGALILFGFVQLTMIVYGLFRGERPGWLAWLGMFIAVGGLVYLLLPGVSAPAPAAAALMAAAGIAWGFYSLRGRNGFDPTTTTTWNFVGTLPLAAVAMLLAMNHLHIRLDGAVLAVLSGALASGVGYAIWYAALPYLTPMQAANVQLSVPIIAALGGVVVMDEVITLRLLVASVLTLGGIALVILARTRPA